MSRLSAAAARATKKVFLNIVALLELSNTLWILSILAGFLTPVRVKDSVWSLFWAAGLQSVPPSFHSLQLDFGRVGDRLPIHASLRGLPAHGVRVEAHHDVRRRHLLPARDHRRGLDDPFL